MVGIGQALPLNWVRDADPGRVAVHLWAGFYGGLGHRYRAECGRDGEIGMLFPRTARPDGQRLCKRCVATAERIEREYSEGATDG